MKVKKGCQIFKNFKLFNFCKRGFLSGAFFLSSLVSILFWYSPQTLSCEAITEAERAVWDKVQLLGKEKNYEQGIKEALAYLKKDPKSPRIHFLLGKLYHSTGKFLQAKDEIEYVLRVKLVHKPSLEVDEELRKMGSKKFMSFEEHQHDRQNRSKVLNTLYIATKLNPMLYSKAKGALETALEEMGKNKTEQNQFDKNWLKMMAHFNFLLGKRKKAGEYFMQVLDLTTDNIEEFLIDNLLETLFKSKEEIFMDKVAQADPNDPEFKEAMDEQTQGMTGEDKENFQAMIGTAREIRTSVDGIENKEEKMAAIKEKKKDLLKKIDTGALKLPAAWQSKINKMKSEGKSLEDVAGQFLGD